MRTIAAVVIAGGVASCSLFVKLDGFSDGAGGVEASTTEAAVGADAAVDVTEAGGRSCPKGRGPDMVVAESASGARFCIDSTEVTQAQYKTFLDDINANPQNLKLRSECAAKTSFTPGTDMLCRYDPAVRPNHAAVCIDWCNAATFCTWAGKRLCGRIGGGSITPAEATAHDKSEWIAACTRGGTRIYPYGNTFELGRCDQQGTLDPGPPPVATYMKCEGGADGLFDMIGGGNEWVDSCLPGNPEGRCVDLGSGWQHADAPESRCDVYGDTPGAASDSVNAIRCCADLR